jgi:hypothetical protein
VDTDGALEPPPAASLWVYVIASWLQRLAFSVRLREGWWVIFVAGLTTLLLELLQDEAALRAHLLDAFLVLLNVLFPFELALHHRVLLQSYLDLIVLLSENASALNEGNGSRLNPILLDVGKLLIFHALVS